MFTLLLTQSFAYTPVIGIDFAERKAAQTFDYYHGITLKIQLNRLKNTEYFDQLIYGGIYASSLASWKKIEPLGIIDHRCISSELIEIFEISEAQLNNPTRFPSNFIGNPLTGKPNLWGFYDPRNSEPGYDAIVISPHGDNSINFGLIVHEMAHYWYSVFCLDSYMKMTSEQFAMMIERENPW